MKPKRIDHKFILLLEQVWCERIYLLTANSTCLATIAGEQLAKNERIYAPKTLNVARRLRCEIMVAEKSELEAMCGKYGN